MRAFRSLSISGKLMRMNMIVGASVLLLACAAFIGYELLTYKSRTAGHLASGAEIVSINVTPALQFNDEGAAEETLGALRAMPNIVAAAVYKSDATMFAKYGSTRNLPSTLALSNDGHRIDAGSLIVYRRILVDGNPAGMVYIQSDLSGIRNRLRGYVLITLFVLGASFLVALAISSMLRRRIAEPILSLADTSRMIASKRDYSTRAEVRGEDEIGMLGSAFNDMLRQIEKQNDTLGESERNFRELANAMPQIVWTASAYGEPEYFNQRWFDYAGATAGLTRHWTEVTHPDDLHRYAECWRESVLTGTPFNIEHRMRREADGVYRWHLARALPVHDRQGHIIRWFGTFTDIDDQKRAEAEVRQINEDLEQRVAERTEKLTAANRELANANQSKDRFLATMSHELRTPLNAIIGFTGTLLMKLAGPLTADQESQLQTIRGSARHLLSLINDLLDLAKIESGKVVLNFQPVSFRSVVHEVATSLSPLAQAKGLQFDILRPDEDIVMPSDARALSQIVINLTSNAIKFTEKGFVRLELKKVEGDGQVEISVTDSGMGIREEDQTRLFEAFEQLGGTTKRHLEGTGLGLHLSQKLASLLGGKIFCESTFGQGSRFSLVLSNSE